tara:strand:- start:925 stop:1134 length:210 start_codon:yes stop_codon:yes gene_type:complete
MTTETDFRAAYWRWAKARAAFFEARDVKDAAVEAYRQADLARDAARRAFDATAETFGAALSADDTTNDH